MEWIPRYALAKEQGASAAHAKSHPGLGAEGLSS